MVLTNVFLQRQAVAAIPFTGMRKFCTDFYTTPPSLPFLKRSSVSLSSRGFVASTPTRLNDTSPTIPSPHSKPAWKRWRSSCPEFRCPRQGQGQGQGQGRRQGQTQRSRPSADHLWVLPKVQPFSCRMSQETKDGKKDKKHYASFTLLLPRSNLLTLDGSIKQHVIKVIVDWCQYLKNKI